MVSIKEEIEDFRKILFDNIDPAKLALRREMVAAAKILSKGDHAQVNLAEDLIGVAEFVKIFPLAIMEELLYKAKSAIEQMPKVQ